MRPLAPSVEPVPDDADRPALPDWVAAARGGWTNTGARRPPFAIEPGPGQESVWDYPRPPAFVPDARHVQVTTLDGATLIAETSGALRVLETAQAPAFYLPPGSIVPGTLVTTRGRSMCEWKGEAEYVALAAAADRARGGDAVGWRYPRPFPEFAEWAGWVSFYPDRVACLVDGERARAMAGGFYGGWITDEVVGPCKGEPGTSAW